MTGRNSFYFTTTSRSPAVGLNVLLRPAVPAEFANGAYSSANLDKLRREMRSALKEEGLFEDEADALLNTWELSYFKSAGLRVFFLVPRVWTIIICPSKFPPRPRSPA